jgi:alpha-galactosidase
MKNLIFSAIFLCAIGSISILQAQTGQSQDILIATGTSNTDLVYKVNGRDGRLYQSYLGTKLNNTTNLIQLRDEGHLAYATFGTDNLFEPAIRMTHNDGNPSLELKYQS